MIVSNSIALQDHMTPVLRYIIQTMNMMISNMQRLDARSNLVGTDAFSAMRRNIASAEIALDQMERELNQMYHSSNATASSFGGWGARLIGVWSTLQLIRQAISAIGRIAAVADEYTSLNARLSLINDGLQTQSELQEKIMRSANQTRSSYAATASLVTKIGMTGAMKTNDDAIAFAEKVNMLLKIGGGTNSENEASLLQLSQAMGSGQLQGDEFKSLKENAPALMSAIADGLGISMQQMKQMATAGELTTEKIIGAFESMDKEIREQFMALPRTFGENATVMSNLMTAWIGKFMETGFALWRINERFTQFVNWLYSAQGQNLLDIVANTLNVIVFALDLIVSLFVGFWSMISEAGPVFESVLTGIIVAGFFALAPLIWSGVTALGALVATAATAVAPFLPIVLIVGVITFELRRMGITFEQIFATIGSVAGTVIAFVINRFIDLINFVGKTAVFIQNAFNHPVWAIQTLFYNMINAVLSFFESLINGIIDGWNWIASGVNSIPGVEVKTFEHVSLSSKNPMSKPATPAGLNSWKNIDYVDSAKFAEKGAAFATGLLSKGEDAMRKSKGAGGTDVEKQLGEGKNIGDVGKVGKVGKIEDKVNIADEDLKMLMDIVTKDRVNQINLSVQTQSPVIHNSATIREEADLEKLANKLAEKLDEAAETSADIYYDEGVI
ncbi:tape measure protein [Filifactor villosus]|uniref:Tape measure protein n=1 Tax=Filifactor villosus TaxID=29374 RepID=A0ABV9QM62_9FIRM